jgi:hypothetical protein
MADGAAPAEAPVSAPALNSNSAAAASLPTPVSGPVATTADTSTAPAAPVEGLPAEFKSMAEFTAAYEALKSAPPAPAVQEAPASDPMSVVENAAKAAGLDLESFNAEYMKDGKLSEKSIEALAKAGVNKAFLDAAIAGQEALVQNEIKDIFSVVGGEEGFKQIHAWASANLSPAEKTTLNNIIDTQPAEVVKLALTGLQARYERTNGVEPVLLNGNGNAPAATGYQSRAQMVADMSNPLYGRDEAFRAQVEARLAATTAF